MMSTILVTGGTGFLGQHIVRHLCDRGDSVRVMARPPVQPAEKEAPGLVYADIRDYPAVERAVAGVDAVIHLVSNFRKGGSDEKEAYAVNVEGTENVLKAALKHGVSRVVHCSTIGVHGDVKEIPATEETPFNPCDLYQETKLLAEQRVWEFHRQTGLPVAVVRPISLLGPGDKRMLKLFKMIKKGRFVMVGKGEALFQPAYIDDVVRGFMLCLDKEEALGEAFIIGSDEYLPLRQLVNLIAEELGVPAPRRQIPLGPVLTLARLSEAVFVPLGIEPPLHRRRVSFFQNNRAFKVDKARRILGYQPEVSLREAVRRTIHWYEEKGWL
jgi:dihydroflavonol-4-reductase